MLNNSKHASIMKKIYFFIFFIFISYFITAQHIYFPKIDINDSAKLPLSMSRLAIQVVKYYKEDSKEDYLDNLFRFQNVSEEYKKSLNTLDTLLNLYRITDPLNANGIGFPFKVFAETKLYQNRNNESFNKSFHKVFMNLYNELNETESITAAKYFNYDIKPIYDNFKKVLNRVQGLDTISFEDAKRICRAYNSYNVYNQVLRQGKEMLKNIENAFFIIDDSVLIKTRDGSTISATIVKKKNLVSPKPVILSFTIYPGPSDVEIGKQAAINDYVGVVANTRGKRLSPQDIEPFEHDGEDVYDVIDWITKQGWCNGKIGMFGGSYPGFTQWAAVKNIHPSLKTIVPQVPVGVGISFPISNNIFKSYMLNWIHYVTNNKQTDENEFHDDRYWNSVFSKWYKSGESFRALDSIEGRQSKIFQRWLKHPGYDKYWQGMIPYKNDFSKINIPILTITGYFDNAQLGSMYYLKELNKYNKLNNHYLLIGPYNHEGGLGTPSNELNGYKIDSVANINIKDLVFKWFDFILKDSTRPTLIKDRINYEVMGTNTWKHTSSLSTMNNDTLSFYFSNISSGKYFKLFTHKPTKKEFIKQEVNFLTRNDTSDFNDEAVLTKIPEPGEYISFISDPFENPISINSSFFGEVKTIINKKDYDLNIRLYELLPDGTYFNLSHFLGRASYAKDRSKRQLLTPGKEETIPYSNSFFTSKLLRKGSRLVVLVGVNKNKYWQVNYGTGKDVSDETIQDGKTPLEIKWMNDSYIKIPVWRDK